MPGGNLLTEEQREFVMLCLAEYLGPSAICREFQKKFGRSVAKQSVSQYKYKHGDKIEQLRERLRHTILTHIPIASKYHRLKALDRLFREGDQYRLVRYSKGVNRQGVETRIPIYEKPIGELRSLLQLAAQEMGDLREVHEIVDRSRDEYVAKFEDGEEIPFADASEASVIPEDSVN